MPNIIWESNISAPNIPRVHHSSDSGRLGATVQESWTRTVEDNQTSHHSEVVPRSHGPMIPFLCSCSSNTPVAASEASSSPSFRRCKKLLSDTIRSTLFLILVIPSLEIFISSRKSALITSKSSRTSFKSADGRFGIWSLSD